MKFLNTVDFERNQAQKLVVHNNADPALNISGAVEGQLAWDSTDNQLQVFDGTSFVVVGAPAFAAPSQTINAGDAASAGSASTGLRSDAQFAVATAAAVALTPSTTDAEGVSTSLARADHTHSLATAAPSANLTASTANGAGTAASFARSDHSHAITANVAAGTISPNAVAAVGTSAALARADHTHAIATATASTISGTNTEGSSTSFARADHNHALGSGVVGTTQLAAGVRLDTINAPTASVSLNSQRLVSVADPTAAQDAATKNYVDNTAQGLDAKNSVRVASTANVNTASPGTTIDGVTLANGDRVLLKDQSTASQNGIWVFNGSASAMTRPSDADSAGDLSGGTFVFVEAGTTNADSGWVIITDGSITPGTTAHNWTQFSGAGQIIAGAALTKTGNTLDVAAGTGLEISSDTIRIATAAAGAGLTGGGGSALAVNPGNGLENSGGAVRIAATAAGNGLTGGAGSALAVGAGTGILSNADDVAVDTTVIATRAYVDTNAPKVFTASLGNGAATSIPITHNFNTRDVIVEVYTNAAPYDKVFPEIQHTDANTVTFEFGTAPAANAYRAVIIGIDA